MKIKGLSFYICIGEWSGFKIDLMGTNVKRICLGWISFGVLLYHLECVLYLLSKEILKRKEAGTKQGKGKKISEEDEDVDEEF